MIFRSKAGAFGPGSHHGGAVMRDGDWFDKLLAVLAFVIAYWLFGMAITGIMSLRGLL